MYHVYAIRASRRDALAEALNAAGIQCGIHYPIPVHLQKAYADPRYGRGDFPVSECVAGDVLSLPIYPELTEAQIDSVVAAVAQSVAAV